MFGRQESELKGGFDSDVFPPEVVARLRADDRRVMQAREPIEIEEALVVDGRPCTYLAIKFPLLDAQGEPYAICGIATDITRRKRGEEALRSAALAVSSAEGDAVFQELTRYLATTLGVECAFVAECSTPENSAVRTLAVFIDGTFEDNIQYGLAGTVCGTVVGREFRFVPQDVGRLYPEDRMFRRLSIEGYAAFPLNDSLGQPLGLIAVMSRRPLSDPELIESMLKIFSARAAAEIERKRAEHERRVSEASYRAIFEACDDAIFIHDWETGAILDVNPRACEVYGYSYEEMKRLRVRDISSGVPPYTEEHAWQYVQQARLGKPVRFEWHRRNKDGSLHWDDVCLQGARIAGRDRIVAFTREITDRKRTEAALRSAALAVSTAEGDTVFADLVRDLAATLDVDVAFVAQFLEANRSRMKALATFMYGAAGPEWEYELAGTPCEAVVGREFRAYASGLREQFRSGPLATSKLDSYAAFPLNDTHGRPIGLLAVADRKPISDQALFESVLKIFAARAASEIDRKRAEQELRASEAQYRAIFNASVDGMVVLDSAGRIVDVNSAFSALFGYAREELLGQAPAELLAPDDPTVCADMVTSVSTGQGFQRECRAARSDGSPLDIEVRGVPMLHQGRPHLLAVVRDITERKGAEQQRAHLEAQLRQAQKMEAIGHLTGGIAHDFNNILTSVMGYIVLAAERQEDAGDAKLARYLEQAHLSAQRARDLIQQMLTFSRGQRGQPRPLLLAPLVKESVKLLRSTMPATLELRTDLDSDTPAVLMDPVQVEQVLLNLCINARDAVAGSGRVAVSVRVEEVAHTCASCRQSVRGRFVALSVRDTGPGIAPQIMDRMFEPFYSTKEVGKGSGMGLAMVHGIVHEHGGHILVDSSPGEGAGFTVLLAALPQEQAQATAVVRGRAGSRRARATLEGRVLVVEDERTVGEFMSELLESWGLQVTVQNSPLQARDLFLRDPTGFDLVVTDQTMPRLTGLQLARELVEVRPQLPVILYTGYSENLGEEELQRCGVRVLVKKPVEPAELYAAVRDQLRPAVQRPVT
jgi:PAS domain S-box-containing protein